MKEGPKPSASFLIVPKDLQIYTIPEKLLSYPHQAGVEQAKSLISVVAVLTFVAPTLASLQVAVAVASGGVVLQ